jgi:hypothetical protein
VREVYCIAGLDCVEMGVKIDLCGMDSGSGRM